MKKHQKEQIRLFILGQLDPNVLRSQLGEVALHNGIDEFDAMEFFENELNRIEKLFNYPNYN
jgi:hypothetical protein